MAKQNSKSDEKVIFYPPVVAVLGHVDHGKTTLLDTIRKTTIAAREHGGITQKIGASQVEILHEGKKRKITFIDTPGHEAFSKMRSRGAQAADIGLLIISSVDGVMPQTKESIALLQASQLPFIVVLTKADAPEKNPEKAKQQLMSDGILLEGLGGEVPVIEVSAKTGKNIQELLELILLVLEMAETPFEDKAMLPLKGIVIESKMDQRSGPRATVVIKEGIMHLRDELTCDGIPVRVRTLLSDKGEQLQKATVGDAVEVLGFEKVPAVGGVVASKSAIKATVQPKEPETTVLLKETVYHVDEEKLTVILSADTQGSLEAILQAIPPEITIISSKTGDITSADILLAKSIGAIVLGFNVKIPADVAHLARTEKVLLKNYTIIYELLSEITDAAEGKMLSMQEEILGEAKVLASFPFEKTKVLGIKVVEGRVARGDKIRIMRKEETVGESTITSVRQGKNQTSKIEKGAEGGIIISPFLDFTIGDMVLCLG